MLQQEFEERVKMSVSYKEFEAIHEVYLNSDYNKDEFCKVWVKMNQSRVNQAIKEAKERERIAVLKDKAADIYMCYSGRWDIPASKVLTKSQRNFCESIGIKIKDVDWNEYLSTTMGTVVFHLHKFVTA